MTDDETIAAVLLRANQNNYLDVVDVNILCNRISQLQVELVAHKAAIATLKAQEAFMLGVRNDIETLLLETRKERDVAKTLLREWLQHPLQDSRALEIVDAVRKWCET